MEVTSHNMFFQTTFCWWFINQFEFCELEIWKSTYFYLNLTTYRLNIFSLRVYAEMNRYSFISITEEFRQTIFVWKIAFLQALAKTVSVEQKLALNINYFPTWRGRIKFPENVEISEIQQLLRIIQTSWKGISKNCLPSGCLCAKCSN